MGLKGVIYYKLLKSNQSHCWVLSTTINWFESCFEPEMSNNSSKKTQSDFVAMLHHTLQ